MVVLAPCIVHGVESGSTAALEVTAPVAVPANAHAADPKAVKHTVPATDAAATSANAASSDDAAAVRAGTVVARNRIHISDSRIVLATQDKKALLRAIADAVLARSVNLRSGARADDVDGATTADKADTADTTGGDDAVKDTDRAVKADAGAATSATSDSATKTKANGKAKAAGVAVDARTASATPSDAGAKMTTAAIGAAPSPRITIAAVLFSVSRDAFLYYVPDPRDAAKSIVRLGWRFSLADWKAYRALLPPAACEVKRVIGSYYYC